MLLARNAKKAIVAVARHLAVDLWRIQTGRCSAAQLGLNSTETLLVRGEQKERLWPNDYLFNSTLWNVARARSLTWFDSPSGARTVALD